MASIEEILDGVKPAERTVKVCLDGSVVEPLEQLRTEWTQRAADNGALGQTAEQSAIVDRIRELQERAEAATVEFRLRSIGSKAYRRLIAEHPPVPDDPEHWRFNPDTFCPALLAASCAEPAMTEDQANQLAEKLSTGQWAKLWAAALDVNAGDDLVPKFGPATSGPPSSG